MNDAKDGVKKFVSNEQVYTEVMNLYKRLDEIGKDIELIKVRTGFRDTPLGRPERKNYNTDPGPWKKPPAPDSEEAKQNQTEYLTQVKRM
jgi:hypothetical protein